MAVGCLILSVGVLLILLLLLLLHFRANSASPHFWLRLLAWIASIILFAVHGVVYDIRQKRRKALKAAIAELKSESN
jgi:uncharacterized membrane protein YbhN (UPF0104 family)